MTLGQRSMDMQPDDDNGFQASAPGNRRIAGEIKWFDRRRGFGFVLPEDGSEDILIHCSTIEPLGRRDLPEGCAVTCEYRDGAKGRHVVTLLQFDENCEELVQAPARAQPRHLHAIDSDQEFVPATVKWFSRVRGYGFLESPAVDDDVFVHMETLRDAGFGPVEPEDRMMIQIGEGKKGPMAITVRQDHRQLD